MEYLRKHLDKIVWGLAGWTASVMFYKFMQPNTKWLTGFPRLGMILVTKRKNVKTEYRDEQGEKLYH